jgi:hypothetical protein
MGYEHTNSKGMKYHLHSKVTSRGAKLMFFSKDPADSIDLPENMQVIEGPTGLPMVKKKA